MRKSFLIEFKGTKSKIVEDVYETSDGESKGFWVDLGRNFYENYEKLISIVYLRGRMA